MRLDPAGLPFIGGALLLALVSAAAFGWPAAILFVVLAAFFAFFFRDPIYDPQAVKKRLQKEGAGALLQKLRHLIAAEPFYDAAGLEARAGRASATAAPSTGGAGRRRSSRASGRTQAARWS